MSRDSGLATKWRPPRGGFSELLRVQARLALREPYFLLGIGLPAGLLVVFWLIGLWASGGVGSSGLTVLELYIPTVLVIGYIAIGLMGLPVTFARDREIGWLRRVSTTPVPPSRLLAAQLVFNLGIAVVATVLVLVLGTLMLGFPVPVGVAFVGVAVLATVEMFSLGLIVAAIAPTQTAANAIAGGLFFPLLFFSGLWVQPVQVSGPLQTAIYYSPAGAAVKALLDTTFSSTPPYLPVATMLGYAVAFAFVASRSFRWE
ncbi:MAG TPA: ABC transporter permease [Thermoplasmata archaeon]|nr:ABC transporter permease [Thermoplasmata archaeon]